MSDVWQGPGWWLASDGKWYPADAEPGAVYEGDLQSSDDPAADARAGAEEIGAVAAATAPVVAAPALSAAAAEIPDLAAPEIPVVAAPEIPVVAAPAPEMPDLALPDLDVPDVEASVPDLASPTGMPDPITGSLGGWQAIGDVRTPELELDIETESASFEVLENRATTVEEDGWTSAFEERQTGSEALDDVVAPTSTTPTSTTPTSADLPGAASATPQVAIPVAEAPIAAAPTAAVPDVSIPVPDVSIPDATAPDVELDARSSSLAAEPIERRDAWRKPASGEPVRDDVIAAAAPIATSPVPEVVDLAIPEDHQHEIIEPPKRNMRLGLGILAIIALVVLIAFLLARLFSGNASTDTANPASTTTTAAEEVAESGTTAAPTSTDAEVAAEPEVTEAPEQDAAPTTDVASVFDLRAGDCIVGDIGAGQVTSVQKVDCEQPHQFEVYREALIESSISEFDEAAISAYAEDVCRTSLDAYVPDNVDQNLKFKFLQPTEDSWNQAEDPDRVVTCLLFDGDEEELVGRAR